ncbi:flavocytochrome c [Paenibacillus sp. IHBB 10380]|uniref:flavocytochrome c n=1 Tax=Paenibacillus sp. IHBB 10380 TaxID=1566358 RepID=UPI0005D7BFEF|nr:flavocytochrome c [Paenibacillus sp. IHBB 10380]AJS61422.1 fumarate reductase [Paenibacillus sp. IHBB 10380]
MNYFKKGLSGVVVAALMLTSIVGCSSGNSDSPNATNVDGTLKTGLYAAEADGFHGKIKIELTVDDAGKVGAINVLEHGETAGVGDVAIKQIPADVVEYQSLNVDSVSGATFSSNGVKEAIAIALKDAGANVDEWKKKEVVKAAKDAIEMSADVIVIGAGGAGLAAAQSAKENGASVIVIDKMDRIGGNTALAGGAYNAVDPERQSKQDIEDSLDKHFTQTFKGGDEKANPELVHYLVDNALDGIHWLEGLGLEFSDEVFTVAGALWPRSHRPVNEHGGFVTALQASLEKNDVEVLTKTEAKELIIENGTVVGLKGTSDGADITIRANKGVILATGGYAASLDMRHKYNPEIPDSVQTTNHPGATGDGLVLGEQAGANLVGMEYLQSLPLGDPETGSLTGWLAKGVESYMFVNKAGERFIREDARRDEMTQALMQQEDSLMYVIADSNTFTPGTKNNFDETIEQLVETGKVVQSDSLEELAKKINVDPETFTATIEYYNQTVDSQKDEKYGREILAKKMDKAPYFASPRVPTAHHTMGGLEINTNTEVINTAGKVIPGLYAAGEVTGGIHGSNRLGGNAIADTIVFGRTAGAQAAKFTPAS